MMLAAWRQLLILGNCLFVYLFILFTLSISPISFFSPSFPSSSFSSSLPHLTASSPRALRPEDFTPRKPFLGRY